MNIRYLHRFRGALVVASLTGGVGSGCVPELENGEIGDVRVMGTVRGDPPRVLPPALDRDGNYYVLEGDIDYPAQTRVSVGAVEGGWQGSCSVTKGDFFGAHGWLGGTQDHLWYWSGFALVGVSGTTGHCDPVLATDPSTGASLDFLAVIPDVRDAPSTTSVVAWIQSPSDLVPYSVVVDLRAERYIQLQSFEPREATNVQVLGVGANRPERTGVVVASYQLGEERIVEAITYDDLAEEVDRYRLDLPETFGTYSIEGFIEFSDAGLGAAVIGDGFVLALAQGRGILLDPTASHGMQAVGVHRYDGELFVVGVKDDRPVIARLNNSARLEPEQVFSSSINIAANLAEGLEVIDDRATPRQNRRWSSVRSATGPFPLVSAHTPGLVAEGIVVWAFAGPFFMAAGEPITQIGIGPVGVNYP